MGALGSDERPLRVAVVGSGPAGFYAADMLFKSSLRVQVDLFERLPMPYGLVRYGVAPDHPTTRTVIRVFERVAASEGFRFFGNVSVGRDITVDGLRAFYDAVIFACGMENGARLGIPGEDLPGSHTADEFLLWVNAHPDYSNAKFNLDHETAVVIGQGNVAIDAARLLVRTPDELRKTDIAGYAFDALAWSRVREVHLVGRRGPAQAKFSQQEIEELGELADCVPVIDPVELTLDPASVAEIQDPRGVNGKRNLAALTKLSEYAGPERSRRAVIRFLLSPVEIRGDGRVEEVVFEKNQLVGEPFALIARGTGKRITIPCGLVLRAVGHYGSPLPGVPFDEKRRLFPNERGRIVQNGTPLPGLYATGWIKRGPTGLIGTNKADSTETVDALLEDASALLPCVTPDSAAVSEMLAKRGVRVVSQEDWRRINAAEEKRGEAKEKLRERFTTVDECLAILERAD